MKKAKDSSDSWTFENGKDIYNQKSNKIVKAMKFVFVILLLVGYYYLLNYYENTIKIGLMIIMIEIATIFLIWSWMKGIVKKYWPMVIIPIIALTIVVLVVNAYAKGNVQLQQSDILSFFGNYLAFLGTFCLGYFIYMQDRTKMIEEKRRKVRLLIALIEKANIELLCLHHLQPEDYGSIGLITYNSDWILYYYEYESLMGENIDLKRTWDSFFYNISCVNEAIENGQIEQAVNINDKYLKYECYSISKYNEWEAITCLQEACYDFRIRKTKSWVENKEVMNSINELCKKYYYIIENYIYVWLLRHNVQTVTLRDNLNYEIVDWLLVNSAEMMEKVKSPIDKRIISKVVFDGSLKFNSKSKRINYIWGEYSLK